MISIHLTAIAQQAGNNVVAEVILRFRIRLILYEIPLEHVPVENIDTHGSQVRFGILRFLLEFGDLIVLIRHHQTEAGSLLPGYLHDGYAEFRALFLMEPQEITVILLAYLIS